MRIYLISFLFAATTLLSCEIRNTNSQNKSKSDFKEHTTVQVFEAEYDFGTVKEGTDVSHEYRFKNTGDKPLVVTAAMASCGCTVPEKPEHPIAPGETGSIKATFHSQGRVGPASKTITVVSNTEPSFPLLKLTGTVKGSED